MGSVEFTCDCGEFGFLNSTDNRSYVAQLIPDQEYDAFSEIIDAAIEKSGPTPHNKDAACMAWRTFPLPRAWQCPRCGALYIETHDRQRHRFLPASDEVSKQLFKRR